MNAILFPFNMFTNLLLNLWLPVRLSNSVIFNLNVFGIFVGCVVISIIVFVISKIMNIEFNIFMNRQTMKLDKKVFSEKPVISKQNGFIVKKTNFR